MNAKPFTAVQRIPFVRKVENEFCAQNAEGDRCDEAQTQISGRELT
jgi:hypothetical protein